MNTFRTSPIRRLVLAVSMALLASSVCLGVEKIVRIKNPSNGVHIADGASVTVSGDMLGARSKNAQGKWQVDYPKVRVELWAGFYDLLLGGSEADMTFPVEESANGAWSTSMTFNQVGGVEWPYLLSAAALDAFNSWEAETEDVILVSIE